MKTKEYVERILAVKNDQERFESEIVQSMQSLIKECAALVKARNAKTDSALKSIVLDIMRKWQSISIQVNSNIGGPILKPEGFANVMIHQMKVPPDWFNLTYKP